MERERTGACYELGMLHSSRSLPCLALALALSACTTTGTPGVPARAPSTARAPLSLTYLGVAGWQISAADTTLLVDPYFSRPTLADDAPAQVDEQAVAQHVPKRAALVMVGHSHVDHLLDAPTVARLTGAQLMGTPSTAHYGRASGLAPDRIITVAGGEDHAFGSFAVRVIPSLHSFLDDKHTFGRDRTLPEDVKVPLAAWAFAEGGTLSYLLRIGGREVLVLGTANFIERELEGIHPDVAIIATGLRGEVHDYTCRLMRVLGQPPRVLTNHFDAWREPLSPTPPLSDETRADLAAFTEEVRACSPHTQVQIPERFATITLD